MSKWSECAHTSGVWRVCARSGSCCIQTGRRRQRLTEGVSEAWCWRAVIVTTTNHILLWCCMNGIGYLHEAIWLADASVGAWKVEKFSTSAASSASEAMRRTHNSARQRLTSLHSKSTRGVDADADAPCEWGVSLHKRRKAPAVISRAYTSLIARAHAHTSHTGCVSRLANGCVQEVKNDINTVRFLTQTARFVS